jgi:hypothetical protein
MTTGTGVESTATPRSGASVAVAWLLSALFCALAVGQHYLFARNDGAVLRDGGLLDTDSYMRVMRIMDLYHGTGWYNTVTTKIGAPEGLSLHWTRPVDILILLPALLAHALGADTSRAVYWIGAGFSPFCHILACFAAVWAARPLWPSPANRFAALILLSNGAAFGYGVFGRADHHTLLLLLAVLMLGAMLRAALAGTTPAYHWRWAAISGVFAGLGVWISPELMVPIVPVIATLGLFWLDAPLDLEAARATDPANGNTEVRDWAGPGAAFALGMAAVVALAIPIEQPPARWFAAEYDKISLPYLVLPLIWAAVFLLARRFGERFGGGFRARALVGLVLGGAGFGLLIAVFPDLLLGPLGNLNPRLKADFFDTIQEMQPLWPTSFGRLYTFLPMVGQAVAALLLLPLAFRAWRGRRRWAGLLLVMVFGFLLIAALLHARLSVEFSPTIAIFCAGFFSMLEMKLSGAPRWQRLPALTLTVIALTYAPLLISFALPHGQDAGTCKVTDLAAWMNAAHPAWPRPSSASSGPVESNAPIVLTDDISYAPELAFRTDYRFVAGPYHRNPQAIFDTIDVLTDTTGKTARGILDRRQVALVIRCTDVIVPRLQIAGAQSLYAWLGRGFPPAWLHPLALPPALAKHFKVFEMEGR